MDFGLTAFKESELGKTVADVVESPQAINDMKVLSRYGFPAAMALGKPLLAISPTWSDADKKLIGRWIRETLEAEGLAPVSKSRRVPPGYLFSVGAVYG